MLPSCGCEDTGNTVCRAAHHLAASIPCLQLMCTSMTQKRFARNELFVAQQGVRHLIDGVQQIRAVWRSTCMAHTCHEPTHQLHLVVCCHGQQHARFQPSRIACGKSVRSHSACRSQYDTVCMLCKWYRHAHVGNSSQYHQDHACKVTALQAEYSAGM